MNNANDMAFPDPHHYGNAFKPDKGLTKREIFAAMAMQGLLASWGQHDVTEFGDIAHDAVSAADALLSALNREQSNPDQ